MKMSLQSVGSFQVLGESTFRGKLRFPGDYLFDQSHYEHSGEQLLDRVDSADKIVMSNSVISITEDVIDSVDCASQIFK